MSEQVLSDDEKNALLDGVSSGAVEVQSADGPQYASVKPYVIGPRARIVSNSFPRLDSMNGLLASQVAGSVAALLQAEVEITAGAIRKTVFADYSELWPARSLCIGFSAAPLTGQGLIVMDSVLVGPLVEAFFGGNCPEAVASTDTAHSPGARSIVHLFARELLGTLREVWLPLRELKVERTSTHAGLDLVEAIGAGDAVIASEFEVAIGEESVQRGAFSIVWPASTVAPLRAALEGKPRDRNAAEDQRWEQALRRRLADVVVDLSSNVGHASMTLGDLVKLTPGDVIGIDTPRVATVLAHGIPLIEGRFGVQAGRNAVEAVAWLSLQNSH
jgi:flagellar motor switch protein FliM